jgi:Xaa-Pro aminopeptidase
MFQSALEKEGCRVIDGTDIVREVRAIKSPQEIAYVEKAAKIAEVGHKAAIETMRPGMTELDVYGEIVNAMAKAGGENPAIPVLVTSGPKCACLHALASRKKIEKGEIVNIDVCGVFNRYHANMARTYSMGKPNPDVARVVELSAGAFDVIAELIRPNLPVGEFNERMKAYYQEAGILRDAWWFGGYELGIAFPPDWVGEFVYDVSIDAGDQLFVPGTVVNYESNFYLPHKAGVSYQINTLVFTEERARILGELSNDIIVIER